MSLVGSNLFKKYLVGNNQFSPLFRSLIFIFALLAITTGVKKSGCHIIYSATSSMPKGFYLIIPTRKIAYQDIVEFIPPSEPAEFAREKKWIPLSGSIIKYVFAVSNDHVCNYNQEIMINGNKIGEVAKSYAPNKPLPQTKFCTKLKEDQYLLLSTKSARSFDGRYFGPVSIQRILGKAVPIFMY